MSVSVASLILVLSLTSEVLGGQSSHMCITPQGKPGESYTEGCLKYTCEGKVWKASLDRSVCCIDGVAFPPTNTTISSTMSRDRCVRVKVKCVKKGGYAMEVIQIENFYEDMEEKSVFFASRGDAGIHSRAQMGSYIRSERRAQGLPVFEKVVRQKDGHKQPFFLFVGPDGRWMVGPYVNSYSGSVLKSSKKDSQTPPATGWYYHHGNKWRKDEALQVTVNMREDCRRLDEPLPVTTVLNSVPSQENQGILISGGISAEEEVDDDEEYWDRDLVNGITSEVELFIPETGRSCRIPDLRDDRMGHTMDRVNNTVIICGGVGDYTENTCLQFSSGSWEKYATTLQGRSGHSSWVSESGLILFSDGAELVIPGASAGKSLGKMLSTRGSCGIEDTDSTIITGLYAEGRRRVVERYNEKGFIEKLPNLNEGRSSHGCGSFQKDGSKVLVVAGGKGGSYQDLSSTEKLTEGGGAWSIVRPLPRRMTDMASASLRNTVYLTGGTDAGKVRYKDILRFDGEGWEKVGEMQVSRCHHAATMVDITDFMHFCK